MPAPDAAPAATQQQPHALSRGLVVLIAVATGAIVANLYYAQPVLHQVAHTFHRGPGPTSAVITATQIGYAAGLLLIVPLGDLHPRRALVTRLFVVACVALVACALAPNLWLFALASVAVGTASVAGQVMIPFAADLAPEERRGRVVARIMTGLLMGILLARTVSGLVAQAAGWRAIFWFSAALMILFALVLWRALPAEGPRPHRRYAELVGSSLRLLVTEPVLRRRAWHGACAFACFSVLWTTLAFLLSGGPYHYSNAVIGLFGLVGAGGIVAANLAGKLADSDRHTATTVVAGILLVASFAVLWAGRTVAGRPHRRHRGARHGHPGHADHQPVRDLRTAPRRPQQHQQRLHGVLLPRRRGRLRRRRHPLRHPRLGGRVPARGRLRRGDAGPVRLRAAAPRPGRRRAGTGTGTGRGPHGRPGHLSGVGPAGRIRRA